MRTVLNSPPAAQGALRAAQPATGGARPLWTRRIALLVALLLGVGGGLFTAPVSQLTTAAQATHSVVVFATPPKPECGGAPWPC